MKVLLLCLSLLLCACGNGFTRKEVIQIRDSEWLTPSITNNVYRVFELPLIPKGKDPLECMASHEVKTVQVLVHIRIPSDIPAQYHRPYLDGWHDYGLASFGVYHVFMDDESEKKKWRHYFAQGKSDAKATIDAMGFGLKSIELY